MNTYPSKRILSFAFAKSGAFIVIPSPIPVPEPVSFDPNSLATHKLRVLYSPRPSPAILPAKRTFSEFPWVTTTMKRIW
ncbi:hypothetical protein GALMADRAFT_230590 [Galerina marginata CBS 339.88]|uniref:Uncharacterized protein n=1 Tax=Galerina marginata (strain CBS 339.88) TaxID=685588 RepID=A0A067SS84_GALM3|nr:hypothetical protein GALMADRAFT_230590 [Galerina marginata CBS 339.88]